MRVRHAGVREPRGPQALEELGLEEPGELREQLPDVLAVRRG